MHGRYAANIAVSKCDVLFSIGTRFNDRITGDLNEFAPKAKIIHVDIDAAAISRNVVVDVPIEMCIRDRYNAKNNKNGCIDDFFHMKHYNCLLYTSKTRWPTWNYVTPSPSFTMVPEFSCPRIFGSGVGVCPSL